MIGSLTRINNLNFEKTPTSEDLADIACEATLNKIDQVKREFTLRDKYYPKVANLIPKTEKILLRHIGQYRDKNISILSSPYPLRYPIFGPDDQNIIFKCTGVDMQELMDDINAVPLPEGVQKKENFTPFPVLMLLIIRYFKLNKKTDDIKSLYYYMAYSMYWSVYNKYFKFHLPNEGNMIYTVNNLSNKFKLKQYTSMDELLFNSVEGTLKTYADRVDRCSDAELYYMIDALKTRLNNYFKKICNEYMINYNNKDTIFKSDTFVDNEGTMRSQSSISTSVEELAQTYTTEFFSSPPNQKRIAMAAKMEGVSVNELKTTLSILHDSRMIDEVKLFYSSLFYSYLSSGDPNATVESIKSTKFLAVMSNIFKKGNSMNKNIVTTKDLMNKWLEIGSATYRATNRQATLTSFKKAIYDYFIMSVTSNK